ncbi:MAG: hypothetical protein LBQ69_04255 [Treponema sp.]|nr:hypothetical protein [Treponema sp.]
MANKAFSGVAGTLATLGVGIGTAALVKGGIDYQNAVVRIATNAGVYGREVNEFGRRLLQIAYDAKVPHQELIAFANTASECAIGLEDITGNMPFMADVIQALGISGEEAGQLFTTLFKRGVDADALKEKLNNLAEIGNRLGDMGITQFAKFLPSLGETSGGALGNIEDLYVALNMLAKGTNKPQQALQQYQSAMNDFAKSDTRDAIRRFMDGFDVLNEDTGELKSFAEIMETLSKFGEQTGTTAYFDKMFGLSDSTIKALKQYNNYYQETIEKVGELGDTSNAVAKRAEQNAGTIEASLTRLKSAASDLASSTLIKPVEKLADLLNQHPRGMEYAVYGLAVAMGTLAVMKAFTTVVSFIGNLKTLKDGGGVAGGLAGGGAGIPVHVTNWGGAAGSTMMPGIGNGGSTPGLGNAGGAKPGSLPGAPNISLFAKAAGLGLATGVATAFVEIPKMKRELDAIKQNGSLTEKERGRAKGGAIGGTSGGIAGATGGAVAGTLLGAIAASAIAGTAIGTAVPGLGNIAGLLIGASVGAAGYYFGGKAGRAIGAGIGGAVAGDDEDAARSPGISLTNAHRRTGGRRHQVDDLIVTPSGEFSTHPDDYIFAMKNPASLVNNEIHNEVRTVQFMPQATPPVVVEGEIELKSELVIDDKGYRLRQQVGKNTTPYKFAVGSAGNARLIQ